MTWPYMPEFYSIPTILARSPWDTQQQHGQDWTFVKNDLRKSVFLFISHCFGHCLPPSSPKQFESACNDSGCEGCFKSTLHSEWRGNARICGFLRKYPKTFGHDCNSIAESRGSTFAHDRNDCWKPFQLLSDRSVT